jgi:hypothetical protein
MSILRAIRSLASGSGDTWRHVVPALVFGITLTAFSLLIYLLLLGEWPWLWSIPRLHSMLKSLDAQGQWAFGQLYTGFVGVFLAGTLGFFAIKEFATAQEAPQLELKFWRPSGELGDAIFIHIHSHGEHTEVTSFQVALHNVGPVIARWYTVQLTVSFLEWVQWDPTSNQEVVHRDGSRSYRPALQLVLGEKENLATTKIGSDWIIRFFSRGAEASYPRNPMILFQFFLPASTLTERLQLFTCPYQINTDRGSPMKGTLTVRVENLSAGSGHHHPTRKR